MNPHGPELGFWKHSWGQRDAHRHIYTRTLLTSLGLRFLLALPKKSRNYVELGSCGKVSAIRGCRSGLCGKRPEAASCQTHTVLAGSAMDCRTPLSISAKLKAPLRKYLRERAEHTIQAEEEGKKNRKSEKYQKEHQVERRKRMFFMIEKRPPHKGPIHKPTLEQTLP